MPLLNDQVRAILWAQVKAIYNKSSGGGVGAGRVFYWIFSAIWYGGIAMLAWLAATTLPEIHSRQVLRQVLSGGLLLGMLVWQIIPVTLATAGLSLDLRKLMVYPIAPSRLFLIEVLLRMSTGGEVLIILAGGAVGVMRSPVAPAYGALAFIPFAVINLLLSAGIRDLLTRLLSRRGVRELVVIGIVTISALPQLILVLFPPDKWKGYYETYAHRIPSIPWPWQLTARLAAGDHAGMALLGLAVWAGAAAWFGYSQFQRGLRWDADAARASERVPVSARTGSLLEILYRLPSRLLADPLGALVEKEIRSLSRAPRFRLVFFMGFSFGLIIWLPLLLGRGRPEGFMGNNFLVWVSLYAALLLGEVLFWNCFGFDRTAAQAYYVMPVKLSTVLIAKNITAVFFLLLEVTIVTAVVLLLRLKLSWTTVPDSYAVTLLVCLFLLTIGNLASTHYPRPVDPGQSWRHSNSGKVQGMLLLAYPVLISPIALAYLARYAFDSRLAFYVVLGSAFLVAGVAYAVSLDSSIEAADKRREMILAALSRSEGPIA